MESGDVITVCCNEDHTVLDLKGFILQSQQTKIVNVQAMRLITTSIEMDNSSPLKGYTSGNNTQQLHCVLKLQQCDAIVLHKSYSPRVTNCARNTSSRINPYEVLISATLHPYASVISACDAIYIRAERDQLVPGSSAFDIANHRIVFVPEKDLYFDTFYTAHLKGSSIVHAENNLQGKDFEWSFRTLRLSSLRLLVSSCCSSTSDQSVVASNMLLILPRQTPCLYKELLHTISSRFGLDVQKIISVKSKQIDGTEQPIDNDRTVAKLQESDTIIFEWSPDVLVKENNAESVPWSKETWEEYYRHNWVNDCSGYLAVCGKMSLEEETLLLLNIVQAFCDKEDNNDGIAVPVTRTVECDLPAITSSEKERTIINCAKDAAINVLGTANASNIFDRNNLSFRELELFSKSLADAIIPVNMRCSPWICSSPPIIFNLQQSTSISLEKPCEFVKHMKTHGYAFLQLNTLENNAIDRLMRAASSFFDLPDLWKSFCSVNFESIHNNSYQGYKNNTIYNKELFQIRRVSPLDSSLQYFEALEAVFGNAALASYLCQFNTAQKLLNAIEMQSNMQRLPTDVTAVLTEFLRASDDCFSVLCKLATGICADVLHQYELKDQSYLEQLFEPPDNHPDFVKNGIGTSRSNLSVFRYNVPDSQIQETVHCPHHSDISLVTVIPTCLKQPQSSDVSGLHLYDWETNLWVNAEKGAPPGIAVVFVGETMTRLTCGKLLPCMHDVSQVGPGPRLSTPFQLCPAQNALLDPSQLVCSTDSLNVSDLLPACHAGQFMDELSASRISSNFPRLL